MKKRSVIIGLLLISVSTAFAQISRKGVEAPVVIGWMSMEEALAKSADEPRKIIVDVYTSWCKWCDKMEEITFQDPEIAQYINDNFYPVKFDAQSKEEILYKDKTYGFFQKWTKRVS